MAQYTHNAWESSTTKKTPFNLIMGYTPKVHQSNTTTFVPLLEQRLMTLKDKRRHTWEAVLTAQKLLTKHTHFVPFALGQKVWLEAKNLRTTHPNTKLAPKRFGPFKITQVLSPITYQIELPTQWKVHNVFHTSLLSPYKETELHGKIFPAPPPDIIEGEPEWEVEWVLDV